MAAWRHYNYWTANLYTRYRRFVRQRAESYVGNRLDCADLSMSLLIDFASHHGLPVTFTDLNGIRYISKSTGQTPVGLKQKHWGNDRAAYVRAVLDRLNAKALLLMNVERNSDGPEPGDLMLKEDHAGIVYDVYPAGVSHPRSCQYGAAEPGKPWIIPPFPGNDVAKIELGTLMYFRDRPQKRPPCSETDSSNDSLKVMHFDYLNHRGYGKEAAELILFAPVPDLLAQGFGFYEYKPRVLDSWADWDGRGGPPRESQP